MQQPTPTQMDRHLESSGYAGAERAVWRRRFVLAERGFTAGFRANSALFFYFFTTSVMISFAVVLSLSPVQWAILLLSVVLAISAELLYFATGRLGAKFCKAGDQELAQWLSMISAAFTLQLFGAIATIILVIAFRLVELYG